VLTKTPVEIPSGIPAEINVQLSCPTPLPVRDTILLGHGSGGKLTAELVRDIFLPAFQNPALARLDDQAIVNVNGQRLAMTTDSFVVKPLFRHVRRDQRANFFAITARSMHRQRANVSAGKRWKNDSL
jgi:hypothetical protein